MAKPVFAETHAETFLLHGDEFLHTDASVTPPIPYAATFLAADAESFAGMANTERHPQYYTRYGNPLHERVAALIAELEHAESGLCFSSGMGGIAASFLALLKAGDHVVAQKNHYMATSKLLTELLPRYGVETTLVDQSDAGAFEAALRPNTRLIHVETPANPTLALTDLAAIAGLAQPRGILTSCDNTFASPINQTPRDFGIDLVMHSATKYMGGHHDITAGVVVGSKLLVDQIWHTAITLGATLSPMDAWLLLRGLRTLVMRVQRQNASALRLAQFLESHPAIGQVRYPGLASHPQHALAKRQMHGGFGGLLAICVKGGYADAARVIERLKVPAHAVSLGGVESLVVHAAAMWAGTMNDEQMRAAAIEPNMIRVSVGIEHVDDLIADFAQALD
jgi:cystathionine beta-lyase/cystathionine gamma-synthase